MPRPFVKSIGVHKWGEVQYNNLPQKVQKKLMEFKTRIRLVLHA